MNAQYQELHRQADRLYHRFRDKVDQPDSDAMRRLEQELKQVVEDFESDRKPRSIEDRIKRVIGALDDLQHHGGTMIDFADADELHDQYEDMRRDLRKLPDF